MNPPRILIVEDELIVAKDIERKLSKAGYDVEDMVPTGEEAVRKSLVCNPDLVLMDIRLRGPMDGIEAARRILSQADIPIIYLTAHTDEETVQRARGTDPFGYIIKPVESRNLTISIEMALYKHETQKEMRRQLQWLTAMRVIDQTILTHQDIQTTLAEVIQQIAIHLQADAAAILLLQPYSQTLEYTVGCGFHNAAFKSTHFQLGAGNAGNIAKRGRPVHIRDLRAIGEQDILPWMATEEFITYFGVPLICKGQVKGVLEIFQRRPFEPDSHWQNLLEALSDQAAIAVDNLSMLESLRSLNLDLAQAYNATIEGWSSALELRDLETEGHSQRVTETTIKLAIEMGVDVKQMEHIRRGALLHDIGKMGIPDHILLKPGVLTEQERDIMHKHPYMHVKC